MSGGPLSTKVTEQAGLMREQVQHYLDRARAAARAVTSTSATPVKDVVASFIRTFEKIHRGSGMRFTGEAPEGLRFRGERQDLEEMIGNLVDNAGKWAKSTVMVSANALPSEDGSRGRPRNPDR